MAFIQPGDSFAARRGARSAFPSLIKFLALSCGAGKSVEQGQRYSTQPVRTPKDPGRRFANPGGMVR